jgi:AcrR family transcriptional regulator
MRVRTESRREAILEVAMGVFLEAGFEGASMAQIAQRVGGSKATLYGYFPSKEALFVAVTHAAGSKHMEEAAADLASDSPDGIESRLLSFGAKLLAFMYDERTLAAHRMVLGEAGRSDIGERFWEVGPGQGQKMLAEFLRARMDRGELRRADAMVAAAQLLALLNAEHAPRMFFRSSPPLGADAISATVARAVTAFLHGYRPASNGGTGADPQPR